MLINLFARRANHLQCHDFKAPVLEPGNNLAD